MKTFYTNVQVHGSRILYRGVENGRKVRNKIDYHPTLFVPSQEPTPYTTISGEYVSEIKPGNIRDCRDFVNKYKDVQNFKVYGNQKYEYAYISDLYASPYNQELYASPYIDWDRNLINVANIDIEVGSENGFPEPGTASEPITAITIHTNSRFLVYGLGEFNNTRSDVQYIRCNSEIDLLKSFITDWSLDYPDIVTGWNIKFFDIPYLVNRITKILGEEFAKRLSPWSVLREREVIIMGKPQKSFVPLGVAVLDYIELYKKFVLKPQDSYKLNAICHDELGEKKLSYDEYGSLHTLYKDNHQLFIEYNIRDVELVEKLDEKLKLIDLALTLAYDSKTNYEDVFAQVRMWDALTYNELRKQNKVVPPMVSHSKDQAFVGAYVKEPKPGMYKWVASFDLNSLYPHLIMEFNISPDKFVEPRDYTPEMQRVVSQAINVDTMLYQTTDTTALKSLGVTLTPNGQLFRVDSPGFLAKMMQDMYNDRTKYKKKAQEAKKELEAETDAEKRIEIEARIARFNNLQLAKKVCLNSAYGATGNEFFRFFDVRQASAITTSGQLAIRWIEKKLNQYLNNILGTKDEDYIIASDTDSIYINFERLVNKTIKDTSPDAGTESIIAFLDKVCETKIQSFIDKSYQALAEYTNALDQKMFMKREALADRGIWTAKKRYILNVYNNEGIAYAKPKVKVMGLEMIKSSTPTACRSKLWEAVDVILNKTEDDMIDFIEDFRKEFSGLPVADIAFPRGVNNVEKYTRTQEKIPIHVRGSIVYNQALEKRGLTKKYQTIKDGEKIRFIYLKEPNLFHSNVIAFPLILPKELDLESYIDYNLQFEKSFLEPLRIILKCIGWKTEKTISLEDFFS